MQQPKAEFGGSRSGFVAVGAASVQVIAHNDNRKLLVLINDSDSPIYLSKGDSPALVNAGVRINANGGVALLEPDILGRIWKGAIQGISTGAAKNLTWQEDF